MSKNNDKFMSSVKVGAKGQIVIPKKVRSMFMIKPGDELILLADIKKGIAIQKMSIFNKIADKILSGKGNEIYPGCKVEDKLNFAKEVKKVSKNEVEK